MNELSLVFDGPAGAWNEALPLGNGSMGAMSYGWLREEKIELNLDTLWSGTGRSKENKNTDVDWDLLRQKIFAGEYEEAESYCKENILGDWTESYLPAGNLHIDANIPELKEHGSYQRQLSLKDALEQVVYCQDGQGYQREFFVSMSEPSGTEYFSGQSDKACMFCFWDKWTCAGGTGSGLCGTVVLFL